MIVRKEKAESIKKLQEVESGDVVTILEDKYAGLFFIKTNEGQVVDLESGEIFCGEKFVNSSCLVHPRAGMIM